MFLQRQLVFHEFNFMLVDFLKGTVLTYEARRRIFKLKLQLKWKVLIYLLLPSNFVYVIRGTCLFTKLSTETMMAQFIFWIFPYTLGLVTYRFMYTTLASFLNELMNSMLKLELSHLQSKCYRNFIRYWKLVYFLTRSCRNQVHSPTEFTAVSIGSLDPVLLCLCLSFNL